MTGLTFMGYVALFLLGVGLFASVIGFVALLVAAFRQNIRWGLANLFIPGAAIVFAIRHWAKARRGFLLQVMGLAVLWLGTLAANDDGSSQLVRSMSGKAPETPTNAESALRAKEAERSAMEQQLAALQAKLNEEYAALKARRARLGSDPAALAAFNRDAAAYAASKTELSIKAGLVAQLRADEVRLIDQVFLEARQLAKTRPAPVAAAAAGELDNTRVATPKLVSVGPGDIVMYTTKACPACRQAKQYFAARRVAYREVDVETDQTGRAEFDRLGGRGVPLIMVKGRQMLGFNRAELDKLL